ncbi:MAG: LysR family transcriptional regulator [Thioalkalivibrio sp.]|nr:LysR family transcriptional regulator [Thioalkalivibrio sp.]
MSRINFAHLRYFWAVAREGSVTAAADALKVTQPTISIQLRKLEEELGTELFHRHGNRLELTEAGRLVQEYAAEIFTLADAMELAVRDERHEVGHRFAVGIVDSLPLLSAYRLLEPGLQISDENLRVNLRVGKRDRLLAALAARTIDLVLSDSPIGPTSPVHAVGRLLLESRVTVFGTAALAESLTGDFPHSLQGAPFLLHTENTSLRRGLDTWLARTGIDVRVAGEVEEVALLQILGRTGRGFFVAPAFVEEEICREYDVRVVGRLEGVVERFYGLTLADVVPNPAIASVLNATHSS